MKNPDEVKFENDAIEIIRDSMVGLGCRVPKKLAQKWLLYNKTVTSGGIVYWLQIKDLGLGVCQVAKRPKQLGQTEVVKELVMS